MPHELSDAAPPSATTWLAQRWPTAAGIIFAGFVAFESGTADHTDIAAAWDVYHHRVERVVARSMAEFCAVLDTLLAFVVLGVTLTR